MFLLFCSGVILSLVLSILLQSFINPVNINSLGVFKLFNAVYYVMVY